MARNAAGDKLSFSIPWPFAPKAVRGNTDTRMLKLIAMAAMLIDHAGKVLFPQYYVMRIIGRIAFPIYAYCIAVGCVYTKNTMKYLSRIVLLALVSQPIYAVALKHTTPSMFAISFQEHPIRAAVNFYLGSWNHPSILLTLAVGIILIRLLREKRIVLTIGMFLFCYLIQDSLDYGIKGVILMLLFYMFSALPVVSFAAVGCFMAWWGMQGSGYSLFDVRFGIQMFAMLALLLVYLPVQTKLKLPKWLFYLFYPAHLVLIYLLDTFVM